MKDRRARQALLGGSIIAWVALICFGATVLLDYQTAPGTPGEAPPQWPLASAVARPAGKFALVMLAHPNCPCTRASLTELDVLIAKAPPRVAAYVVFSKPGSQASEVHSSDLWRKARAIPGVAALYDEDARETKAFGGGVSGQTMLYDPEGRLLFSGGLTAVRGHEGDNEGLHSVIDGLRGLAVRRANFPVFGCSLNDPAAETLAEESSWTRR